MILAKTSSTILKTSGKSGHLCLVLDCKEKSFKLFTLSIMLVVNSTNMIFIMLNYAVIKCCTQNASKFGKLSSGHRTGKGQFLF